MTIEFSPMSDDERLKEVLDFQFDDQPHRLELNRICDAAQNLLGVRTAAITIVDEDAKPLPARADGEAGSSTCPDRLCAETLQCDGMLVIPDMLADPKYAGVRFNIGGEDVRFYAGAPLKVEMNGYRGTLSILDTEPRQWSEAEAATLSMLANMVENEIRRRRSAIDLRRQQSLWTQAASLTKVGCWAYNLPCATFEACEQTREVFGLDRVSNGPVDQLTEFLEEHLNEPMGQHFSSLVRTGEPFDTEMQISTSSGEEKWVRLTGQPESRSGKVHRFTGAIQDISEERRRAEAVRRLAYVDALTDLPNRASADLLLTATLAQDFQAGTGTGLLLLDLDHFKELNRTYGSAAGDELLRGVADRLSDAMGDRGIIFRRGGDEFGIILPRMESRDALGRLADRAKHALAEPARHAGRDISISVSVGAAFAGCGTMQESQLHRNACLALTQAKATGRNRVVLFSRQMHEDYARRTRTLKEVQEGLLRDEFQPYFQPVMDLKTLEVCGFEALMRWCHPERGTLLPSVFAAAFQDQALAVQLGDRLVDKVLDHMRRWRQEGIDFKKVAINLSPAQLYAADCATRILEKLQARRLPPSLLSVEITEDVYLGWGTENVRMNIRALHAAGAEIALDDFGTGFASLTQLNTLPIDYIKIDKSFLREREGRAVINGLLTMAAEMGVRTVAEGVERPSQLLTLQDQDCYGAQGFLFSQAVAPEHVPGCIEYYSRSAPRGLRFEGVRAA